MANNTNSNNSSAASGGIGFFGLLQVAFIVLKLVGVINWSWGAVLIPLWIEIGLVAATLLFLLVAFIVGSKDS